MTWEREDEIQEKFHHLFDSEECSLNLEDQISIRSEDCNNPHLALIHMDLALKTNLDGLKYNFSQK